METIISWGWGGRVMGGVVTLQSMAAGKTGEIAKLAAQIVRDGDGPGRVLRGLSTTTLIADRLAEEPGIVPIVHGNYVYVANSPQQGAREHGWMFKAELVRAILEGRKTETRRLPNQQNTEVIPLDGEKPAWKDIDLSSARPGDVLADGRPTMHAGCKGSDVGVALVCRVKPGDTAWVRETWARVGDRGIIYRADNLKTTTGYAHVIKNGGRWSPSVHMPRSAARLTMEIEYSAVEHLHAITDAGALAEGVPGEVGGEECPACEGSGDFEDDPEPGCLNCASTGRVCVPRDLFAELWDSTIKKGAAGSWADNPAVWVFRWGGAPGRVSD
jgi:hypothetical protein